ncbi:3-keto-disaccharide hydrolase [Lunatimonas salinarum]|uniref:3-keto-disaccharide hydrolase n=1 Tax=Lunatimonas salinarum TaxID=1774590 RepID=UPI001AE0D496|nr:DUF1080 domain-containing protein [Lunatimonas salinarum]
MKNYHLLLAAAGLALASCGGSEKAGEGQADAPKLSATEGSEWITLFDGTSLDNFKGYGKDAPGEAWTIQDGTLYFQGQRKRAEDLTGGDLVTKETFSDFHLKVEWKISENGNSGIMFLVKDNGEYQATYHTGPEYQLLDNDGHRDGQIVTHRTANLYDLIASEVEPVKPVGEWNLTEIVLKNGELTFFLNGVQTVKTTLWNDAWNEMVGKSKFKDMPDFAKFKEGAISFQDHGDDIWFRNIQIKRL